MGQSQHLRERERLAQKERERASALGPRLLFEQAAGVLQGATQRLALGVRALAGLDLAMRAIQQRVDLAGACRGCRRWRGTMAVAGSATWTTGLRLPSRRANSFAESAEGQRPRRLAYQIVPPPHASAPSRRKATQ